MKIRSASQLGAMFAILGVGACTRHTTAPVVAEPPAVVSSTLEYQVGPFYADSGYTVRSLEYADANGVIRQESYQAPVWRQTLDLKRGDRIYVRAVVDFRSVIDGRVQVVGEPQGFYAGELAERADGPTTVVLTIDQLLK